MFSSLISRLNQDQILASRLKLGEFFQYYLYWALLALISLTGAAQVANLTNAYASVVPTSEMQSAQYFSFIVWVSGVSLALGIAFCTLPEGETSRKTQDSPAGTRAWFPNLGTLPTFGLVLGVTTFLVTVADYLSNEVISSLAKSSTYVLFQLTIATIFVFALRFALQLLARGLRFVMRKSRTLRPVVKHITPPTIFSAIITTLFLGTLTNAGFSNISLNYEMLVFISLLLPLALRPKLIFNSLNWISIIYILPIALLFSVIIEITINAKLEFKLPQDLNIFKLVGSLFPLSSNSPMDGLFIISIASFAVVSAQMLRRNLVERPPTERDPSALSIFPDASNYIDEDGYFERLRRLILQSNGGVIGVTGLRGAGKSALLGAIKEQYRREYCVVWTVAPVSYQSEDKLSFLMSISRTLCQKAIDDGRAVLYGNRSDTQLAIEEFVKSIRLPLLAAVFGLGAILLFTSSGNQSGSFFRQSLEMPLRFSVGIKQIEIEFLNRQAIVAKKELDIDKFKDVFDSMLTAEQSAIRNLLAKLGAVLPKTEAASKNTSIVSYAIMPIPGEIGFDLVAGQSKQFAQSGLLLRRQWLARDESVQRNSIVFGKNKYLTPEEPDLRHTHKSFDGLPESVFDNTSENSEKFEQIFLTESFAIRVNNKNRLFSRVSGRPYWGGERLLFSLAMLRGDPRIAIHLEGTTADLRRILDLSPDGAMSKGVQSPDLASIALIAAFYNATETLSSDADDAKKQEALDKLFLETEQLRELQATLTRYLDILQGRTLQSASAPTAASSSALDADRLIDRLDTFSGTRWFWGLVAIVLLCASPEIWRSLNYVTRGVLNFRLLVLMRECTEFMEDLSYSEGREVSTGFGFRGLSLSGKRALTARNMTLQSLTDRYQQFVDLLLTYYNNKLIVVIDELDKMSDTEHVKTVLLELKGALFKRGCYYLISISEDSANAFRGRMAEGRDIFESTFEDVLTIGQMSRNTARQMVRSRLHHDRNAPELEDAAIDILTMFSGAIPREIVRHLRSTVLQANKGQHLSPRSIGLSIFRNELLQWKEAIADAPYSGVELISLRSKLQQIQEILPRSSESWPDTTESQQRHSIGTLLEDCLEILDPDKKLMHMEIGLNGIALESVNSIKSFRQLAELQACLRLMTMNVLMRHVWKYEKLNREQSQKAIECLRTIMQQPAVAADLLKNLAQKSLGLAYPEPMPKDER